MNRLERVRTLREKKRPVPPPVAEKGDAGEMGLRGFTGEKGDKGDRGLQGLQGIRGLQGIQGKTGLKGQAGRDGIDGHGIVWRSDWSVGAKYSVNDAVACFGSAFICIKDHKAKYTSKPVVGDSWQSVWAVMAERGETGVAGANGRDGVDGGSLEVTNVAPATGEDGDMYVDPDTSTLYVWFNGMWNAISGGSSAGGTFDFIDGTEFEFIDGTYFDFIT